MTRPHPVVGIRSEFSNRRRWRAYKSDVLIGLRNEPQILIPIKKSPDAFLLPAFFRKRVLKCRYIPLNPVLLFLFVTQFSHTFQNLFGHILNTHYERHIYTGIRKFLLHRHRPKSIGEIVFFKCRMRLDQVVTAVMVGQKQSFWRNHLRSTTSIELRNRVLDSRLVGIVDILGGNLHSEFLHFRFVPAFEQRWNPHSALLRLKLDYK